MGGASGCSRWVLSVGGGYTFYLILKDPYLLLYLFFLGSSSLKYYFYNTVDIVLVASFSL